MTVPTVLVAGPRWAGVTSVAAALRQRLPALAVVEPDDRRSAAPPTAVVFVVSAVSPVAGSDCDLIEDLCGLADLAIGVMSKIDTHRQWRDVLATDRVLLAERDARYRDVPWVAVAAAPEFGTPNVDELVAILAAGLADPELAARNQLRLRTTRATSLRKRRSQIVHARRMSLGTVTARSGVQQVRVKLISLVRKRCAGLSNDLRKDIGEVGRGGTASFVEQVRAAAEAFVGEVDVEIASALAAAGLTMPPPVPVVSPEISEPRLGADRVQFRLTAVLGAGFGIGAALASSRLLVGVLPGTDLVGFVAGGALGLLAASWVVAARGLLQDRLALDRWVGEVAVTLRGWGQELVTSRMLATEAAVVAELAARDDRQSAQMQAIDVELRRLAGPRSVRF